MMLRMTALVSIPFKRESVSKANVKHRIVDHVIKSFNSLQTGKRIQRRVSRGGKLLTPIRFNSLQTGKRIQSPRLFVGQNVSIPFKRESVSKVNVLTGGVVSIPFKRESVSKSVTRKDISLDSDGFWFQFPSNGKAYLNLDAETSASGGFEVQVSIPFKRESISKNPYRKRP